MTDEYLWDKSGERDPEIERLETLLAPLAHSAEAPAPPRFAGAHPLRRLFLPLTLAAALLVAASAAWIVVKRTRASWNVVAEAGAPRVGGDAVRGAARLGTGEWLETDSVSRARLDVGLIGRLEVEPNTRLQLVAARPTEHRLSLQRGKVSASIWAPPRLFFVDTPSAVAVDLGCAYTLEVDAAGDGFLRVTKGWVAFVRDGVESVVPAGAVCRTRVETGPGTPYFEDAPPELRLALVRIDAEPNVAVRTDLLPPLVAASRRRDVLTLFHLLSRTDTRGRAILYERMASFSPPPPDVTREGVVAGDGAMNARWKVKLGLP